MGFAPLKCSLKFFLSMCGKDLIQFLASSDVILFKVASCGVPHSTRIRVNWSMSENRKKMNELKSSPYVYLTDILVIKKVCNKAVIYQPVLARKSGSHLLSHHCARKNTKNNKIQFLVHLQQIFLLTMTNKQKCLLDPCQHKCKN